MDGNKLDGDGDGIAGTDFDFRLNVLPGDANQSGLVNVTDVNTVRDGQFTSTATPGYSVFNDVNGSGLVNVTDVNLTRDRQFTALPGGEPILNDGNGPAVDIMFADDENDGGKEIRYAALPQDQFSRAAIDSIARRYNSVVEEDEEEEKDERRSAVEDLFATLGRNTDRW